MGFCGVELQYSFPDLSEAQESSRAQRHILHSNSTTASLLGPTLPAHCALSSPHPKQLFLILIYPLTSTTYLSLLPPFQCLLAPTVVTGASPPSTSSIQSTLGAQLCLSGGSFHSNLVPYGPHKLGRGHQESKI